METLETNRRAVAPALRGAEIGTTLGELPDDLAGAEGAVRPRLTCELVAERFEASRGVGGHVAFRPDRAVVLVHAPTRRVDGGLRVLPVVDDARKDLHVTLRLHGAAHQAEGRDRLTVLGDEGRDDGVVGPLVGADLVGVTLGRDEARGAVLERDASAGWHDARAEAGRSEE